MKFKPIRISEEAEKIIVERLIEEVKDTKKPQSKQGILDLIIRESRERK